MTFVRQKVANYRFIVFRTYLKFIFIFCDDFILTNLIPIFCPDLRFSGIFYISKAENVIPNINNAILLLTNFQFFPGGHACSRTGLGAVSGIHDFIARAFCDAGAGHLKTHVTLNTHVLKEEMKKYCIFLAGVMTPFIQGGKNFKTYIDV